MPATCCALQFPSPFEQTAGNDTTFLPTVRKAVPPSAVTYGVAVPRPTNTLIGQDLSTNSASAPVPDMDSTNAEGSMRDKAYPGSSNTMHIAQDKPYAGGAAPQDHSAPAGNTEVLPPQEPPAVQLGSAQRPKAAQDTVNPKNSVPTPAGVQQLPVFRPAAPPATGSILRPGGGSRPGVSKESAQRVAHNTADHSARQHAGRRSLHALA